MSFPASLTVRTVKGRFVTHPDGQAAKGFVRITLDGFMQGPSDDLFVAPFDRVFKLIDGAFSTMLPATNDPQWTSSFYRVYITTETKLPDDRYRGPLQDTKTIKVRLDVPYDDTMPIDLADVINLPAPAPGVSYILLATKGQPNGVASLGSDGYVVSSQLPPGSGSVSWDDVEDKPSTFPPSTHGHVTSDVTGLDAALTLKADASTVTTALSNKADLVGGVLATSQVPVIAIIDFLGVTANQTTMLALTGQKGDWCIRTDLGQAFIITGTNTTQLSSWTAVPIGISPVLSVNSQTGIVVLGKTDIGLGNANNTADADKPVSTVQQTALDLKAPVASPTFTGTVSGVTAAMVGLGNVSNTADTAKPVSIAQQTALDLKLNATGGTISSDLTVAGYTGLHGVTVNNDLVVAGYTSLQGISVAGDLVIPNIHVTGGLYLDGLIYSSILDARLAGLIVPADHGYCGWTFPPDMVQAATILPTAGLSYVVRVRVTSTTISAVNLHITTAGGTLTNSFVTVHNDAGVYYTGAVTADQSTNWTSGGLKTMALTTPITGLTIGSWVKVRFWVGTATTLPTVSRGVNSNSAITNAGLSAPNFRYSTANSGMTTVALAPTTIGTLTGGATAWWLSLTA